MRCTRCNPTQFQKTSDNVIDATDCFVKNLVQLPGVPIKPPVKGCFLEFNPNKSVLYIDTGYKPAA
ncbi:MAG: hypothetical protein HQK83_10305 [Fibrobacteria bacterium]|nr:hypothetical protein [Fibrobacteria bacterium]